MPSETIGLLSAAMLKSTPPAPPVCGKQTPILGGAAVKIYDVNENTIVEYKSRKALCLLKPKMGAGSTGEGLDS